MTEQRARVAVVLTTVPDEESAAAIASSLVERRLAACVSVFPKVRSTYRWKGEVERADEVLLVIKGTRDGFPQLRDAIVKLHPYEVPEILLLPVEDGFPAYLDWIAESVG